MSFEICATGFDAGVNGTYSAIYGEVDHWSNGTYYLYHDSFYWYISDSDYTWEEGHRKARKAYEVGNDYVKPTGNYTGLDGNPDGVIIDGSC